MFALIRSLLRGELTNSAGPRLNRALEPLRTNNSGQDVAWHCSSSISTAPLALCLARAGGGGEVRVDGSATAKASREPQSAAGMCTWLFGPRGPVDDLGVYTRLVAGVASFTLALCSYSWSGFPRHDPSLCK